MLWCLFLLMIDGMSKVIYGTVEAKKWKNKSANGALMGCLASITINGFLHC